MKKKTKQTQKTVTFKSMAGLMFLEVGYVVWKFSIFCLLEANITVKYYKNCEKI